MPSSSKDIKNIPISISILHEQEYNNFILMLKTAPEKIKKRRTFSDNEPIQFKLNYCRRKTLKN